MRLLADPVVPRTRAVHPGTPASGRDRAVHLLRGRGEPRGPRNRLRVERDPACGGVGSVGRVPLGAEHCVGKRTRVRDSVRSRAAVTVAIVRKKTYLYVPSGPCGPCARGFSDARQDSAREVPARPVSRPREQRRSVPRRSGPPRPPGGREAHPRPRRRAPEVPPVVRGRSSLDGELLPPVRGRVPRSGHRRPDRPVPRDGVRPGNHAGGAASRSTATRRRACRTVARLLLPCTTGRARRRHHSPRPEAREPDGAATSVRPRIAQGHGLRVRGVRREAAHPTRGTDRSRSDLRDGHTRVRQPGDDPRRHRRSAGATSTRSASFSSNCSPAGCRSTHEYMDKLLAAHIRSSRRRGSRRSASPTFPWRSRRSSSWHCRSTRTNGRRSRPRPRRRLRQGAGARHLGVVRADRLGTDPEFGRIHSAAHRGSRTSARPVPRRSRVRGHHARAAGGRKAPRVRGRLRGASSGERTRSHPDAARRARKGTRKRSRVAARSLAGSAR